MKILYWTPLFYPDVGGIERLSADLIPLLTERGHEFLVIASHGAYDMPDETFYHNTPIYRFRARQTIRNHDLKKIHAIRKKIAELKKTFQPDIVHIHPSDPSAYFHVSTTSAFPSPTLVTMHNSADYNRCSYHPDTLMGKLLTTASWVTGVSSNTLKQIYKELPELRSLSSIVYNGVKEIEIEPTPLPFSPPHILCIGRLVPMKGYDIAIKAISMLQTRFPQIQLTIAGAGPELPALQALVADLGLENVHFKGQIDPETVPSLINQGTLVAIPSHGEGLSFVALEAAQMARPVVATRVDGLPEAILHNKTGLLIEPGNPQTMADAITTLLKNPSLANRFGQNGRKRILDTFSLQRCADEYEALYVRLGRGLTPTNPMRTT
ncbi:MAG: glycosyltransferase family 4 protein [Anaerolineales bacterium]|nr:glycosyltransferase family 4 protein [Anaerolineales bacterium]